METTHRVNVADARSMDALDDESVELVVTSPPYPMVEMWDDLFADLDPAVGKLLDAGEGWAAFERMHELLAPVWREAVRVLAPGGIVCINVGDAVSSASEDYQCYSNHVEITDQLTELGLSPLPDVVWKKEANSPNDFVGSGMLPTNAYVTLEHEHILLFRKGGTRSFPAKDDVRYESAYFWEERNEWFADVWRDVQGVEQTLDGDARDRSGAFPFDIPYRLISMYSVYGDTVLDPFWGTGTTSLAALVAGRSSVGYELDEGLATAFDDQIQDGDALSRDVLDRRLTRHRAFVADNPGRCNYQATHYGFPVVTKHERDVRFFAVDEVQAVDAEGDEHARYVGSYEPYEG